MKSYITLICCLFTLLSYSQTKLALRGYDLVSYYSDSPKKGNKEFNADFNNLEFRFNSIENRDEFLSAPDKYLPAYDGYCAYGVAKSAKLYRVNPKSYLIIDGNLHFFYKTFFYSAKKKWMRNESKWKKQAQTNWEIIQNSN